MIVHFFFCPGDSIDFYLANWWRLFSSRWCDWGSDSLLGSFVILLSAHGTVRGQVFFILRSTHLNFSRISMTVLEVVSLRIYCFTHHYFLFWRRAVICSDASAALLNLFPAAYTVHKLAVTLSSMQLMHGEATSSRLCYVVFVMPLAL